MNTLNEPSPEKTEEQFQEATINPNYWRRYGFNRDPFAKSDQKEFFIPSSWEEYLDLLPQFARFCDTLLLIIGGARVGKTTLINLFSNEQNTDTDIFTLRASDCPNANHFLELLHQRYGAPYDASNTIPASEKLHQQLDFLREKKASRLLIIDDAEQLPLDMRQLCLQIIQQQNALTTCLPIILVGETSLNHKMLALLTPTTAQKCLYTIQVQPFSEDETEQYLRWRCTQASKEKEIEFPFTQEDIETIFQASHGVIGDINSVAQHLLGMRTKPGSNLLPHLSGKIIWWGGALIAIAILLVIYQQLTKPSTLDTLITPSLNSTAQKAIPEPAATPAATTPATQNTPSAKRTPSAALSAAAPATPSETDHLALTKPTASSTPEEEGASSEALPHSDAATDTTETSALTTEPAAPPAESAPVAHKVAAPTKPVTVPTHLFAKTMSAELEAHQYRVLKMPPHHFTLQLIASANLHVVKTFVSKHQLGDTALIVPTKRNGKFFYVVLYGNFPNHAAAEKTRKYLQETKKIAPWVRTYKSVQGLITGTKKNVVQKHVVKKSKPAIDDSEQW